MHDILLALHNLLRWAVVILGIAVLARALWGWFGKKAWVKTDRRLGIAFTSSYDVQLLLGILLYFLTSSYGLRAFLNLPFGEVMGNESYRLFAIEHPLIMILAVVFAHLGSMLPKKAKDDPAKHKQAAIFFGLAILLTLAAMPWERPLFPG
jgi:hypothetical protein